MKINLAKHLTQLPENFNYRTVWNLIPFSSELGKCAVCKQGQDSAVHLFAKCSITQQIWKFLYKIINHITQKSSTFEILTPINFYFPLQYDTYSEEISLLVTVTNYCIWRTRLEQLNPFVPNFLVFGFFASDFEFDILIEHYRRLNENFFVFLCLSFILLPSF